MRVFRVVREGDKHLVAEYTVKGRFRVVFAADNSHARGLDRDKLYQSR